MFARQQLNVANEIRDFIIADAVLTLAFSLWFVGGLRGLTSAIPDFIYFVPIAFVGVTCSFVLHELMHKFTAQKFGAIAAFRASQMGLAITTIAAFLGFVVGIPGATMIYTNNFTKREDGIVSLAGPLTNFAVFSVFFAIGLIAFPHFLNNAGLIFTNQIFNNSYFENMISFVLYIAILLAFFNMLPIFPLDGSKVLAWNKPVFFAVIIGIFAIIIGVLQAYWIIPTLAIWLVIAFVLNIFYRGGGLGL